MMDEEEVDVYFQGSQDKLYAFLYPLTGPKNPIFNHITLVKTQFAPNTEQFQLTYDTTEVENIDKQHDTITYTSKKIFSQSNYFYSLHQPKRNCMVWRAVDAFVEFRPDQPSAVEMMELRRVAVESRENIPLSQMDAAPLSELSENWIASSAEYAKHLAS